MCIPICSRGALSDAWASLQVTPKRSPKSSSSPTASLLWLSQPSHLAPHILRKEHFSREVLFRVLMPKKKCMFPNQQLLATLTAMMHEKAGSGFRSRGFFSRRGLLPAAGLVRRPSEANAGAGFSARISAQTSSTAIASASRATAGQLAFSRPRGP